MEVLGMTNAMYENAVVLVGKVMNVALSHQQLGMSYYELTVRVNRLTEGKYDDVPVLAPQWAVRNIEDGMTVKVCGELRMYKNRGIGWQAKHLMVYTKKVQVVPCKTAHVNDVKLIGDIKNIWEIRKTPLTDRVITDFSVMVKRQNGYGKNEKAEVIHCIAWSEQANFVSSLHLDTKVMIFGRVQARAFDKKHSDGTQTQEWVHEVSCRSVRLMRI